MSMDVSNDNNMWPVDEGPNAKNTVNKRPKVNNLILFQAIAFKKICEDLIPDDHPPLGFNCRGGYVTPDGKGEFLS